MAKEIKIFGTGCTKCNRLYTTATEAVRLTGINAELSKISEMSEIIARGVMITPAMMINGQIITMGQVPSLDEMKKLITDE